MLGECKGTTQFRRCCKPRVTTVVRCCTTLLYIHISQSNTCSMLYLDMSFRHERVKRTNVVSAPKTCHSLSSGPVSTVYRTLTQFVCLYSLLFTDPTGLPRSPVHISYRSWIPRTCLPQLLPSCTVVHPSDRSSLHNDMSQISVFQTISSCTTITNKTTTQTVGYSKY
jgi:hypothetical protein